MSLQWATQYWKRLVVIVLLITSILALALGLGLGLGLKDDKDSPSAAPSTADFPLQLGEWPISNSTLTKYGGSCTADNITYADGGVLWSQCAKHFTTSFVVSQYANGSYALAGKFPDVFDNALGSSPTESNSPYYQFPVKFITESGNCDVNFQLIAYLGPDPEKFEIVFLSNNPVKCSVEGLAVAAGYTCTCAYGSSEKGVI